MQTGKGGPMLMQTVKGGPMLMQTAKGEQRIFGCASLPCSCLLVMLQPLLMLLVLAAAVLPVLLLLHPLLMVPVFAAAVLLVLMLLVSAAASPRPCPKTSGSPGRELPMVPASWPPTQPPPPPWPPKHNPLESCNQALHAMSDQGLDTPTHPPLADQLKPSPLARTHARSPETLH